MKKWILGGVIVLAVIAVGAGVYTMLGGDDSSEQASQTSGGSDSVSKTEQVSVEELLTRNASLKCTYDVKDGESMNTGTAYFSGGKNMYGEFTNTQDDKSNSAIVIRNGDTQYVWQKDSTTGYKADVSAFNKEKQQQMSQQFDPDQKYKFNCENWEKDDSKFTPPSSVTFTDYSAQTEQLLNQLQNQQ